MKIDRMTVLVKKDMCILGHVLQVVDVADHQIRNKARRMEAPADLEALFEEV